MTTVTIRGEAIVPPPLTREDFQRFAAQLTEGQGLPLVRQLQLVQEAAAALEDAGKWRQHRQRGLEAQQRWRARQAGHEVARMKRGRPPIPRDNGGNS